jgi:hypothetical protein
MPAYTQKATDDLHAASARAVACHSDRSRPGVGDEMLKLAGEPGSHHLSRRQQRQDSEENGAAPGEDARRCHEKASAHRLTFIDGDGSCKAVLVAWGPPSGDGDPGERVGSRIAVDEDPRAPLEHSGNRDRNAAPLPGADRGSQVGRLCEGRLRRHVALLTLQFLLRLGLRPQAKVLDLEGRVRCRGCRAGDERSFRSRGDGRLLRVLPSAFCRHRATVRAVSRRCPRPARPMTAFSAQTIRPTPAAAAAASVTD